MNIVNMVSIKQVLAMFIYCHEDDPHTDFSSSPPYKTVHFPLLADLILSNFLKANANAISSLLFT